MYTQTPIGQHIEANTKNTQIFVLRLKKVLYILIIIYYIHRKILWEKSGTISQSFKHFFVTKRHQKTSACLVFKPRNTKLSQKKCNKSIFQADGPWFVQIWRTRKRSFCYKQAWYILHFFQDNFAFWGFNTRRTLHMSSMAVFGCLLVSFCYEDSWYPFATVIWTCTATLRPPVAQRIAPWLARWVPV